MNDTKTFKVLMVGHKETNKTPLVMKYISGIFMEDLKLTIGVDFHSKKVEYEGREVKLQIWDFGGEEQFRFLLSQYAKGTNAAMFVYDINNPSTLEGLVDCVQIILEHAGAIPFGLVGMKDLEESSDLSRKTFSFEDGVRVALNYGLSFFTEVSPKTGENINEYFEFLTGFLLEHYDTVRESPHIHKFGTPSQYESKKKYRDWIQFETPLKTEFQLNETFEISKQIDRLLEEYEEWEIFSIVHLEKEKIISFKKKFK